MTRSCRAPHLARHAARRLALAVLLAAPLAAGCDSGEKPAANSGDGDGDSPGATVRKPSPAFLPLEIDPPSLADVNGRYGGTFTWAEVGEVASFNPIVTNTAMESELKSLLFDQLVSYDNAKWEHEGSLAHTWDVSDDYLTYTFHLRKGIQWSDGAPFTARDVVFTYNDVIFNPKIPSSEKEGFNVAGKGFPTITAVDDFTVKFELPTINALLVTYIGGVSIVPHHKWKDSVQGDDPAFNNVMNAAGDFADVVGTGPFKVIEYSGAERVVYERNPLSWRQDKDGNRLPYVDRALVLMFGELSTRTTSFLNGDYDTITDIPAPDYDRVKAKEKEGAFVVHRLGLSLNTNWICFNQHPGKDPDGKPYLEPHKLKLFQNVKFRRAMSHAVDRKNLVKLMLNGKGEAIYGPTSPSNTQWFSDDFEKTEFDIGRATALLDEIGVKDRDGDGVREDADGNRVTIEFTTNVENPTRVKILSQLKADWAGVGVEAVTKPVNFQELVHELEDGHGWELMLLGWGSAVPPDPLFGVNIHQSSGRLHVWYPMQPEPANEWERKADAILTRMQAEPDAAKRKPMWAEYLKHHAEGLPILYLYSQNAYAASKPRVKNLKPSVLRPQTWHNIEELWLDE